jgi:dihydroxy-acid dehydratase
MCARIAPRVDRSSGACGAAIDLLVEDAELKQRAAATRPAPDDPERRYAKLYAQEILGADEGCDFALLKPR